MNGSIAMKDRVKIQGLIDAHTVRAGGDFHSDELNEECFMDDLTKNFKLKPREKEKDARKLLLEIVKFSKQKVVGRYKAKEFKQSIFFKKLAKNFELEKIEL